MLTSFFYKSKPIHFVLFLFFLVVGSVFWFFYKSELAFNSQNSIQILKSILILVFSLSVLDFIINKNSLTHKNSYATLLFVCFVFMFPTILTDQNSMVANLFLLLAFRRLLSLSSEKKTTKKILDTSIFIGLASLFCFWSILFFVVLFLAILQKPTKTYKHFLIPFVGFFAVVALATVYGLFFYDTFTWLSTISTELNLNFYTYNPLYLLIPLSFVLVLFIWIVLHFKSLFVAIKLNKKPAQRLVLLSLIIFFILVLLTPHKTGAEFLFILAPLSILVTNYLETLKEIWFKEILLWVIVLLPIARIFM